MDAQNADLTALRIDRTPEPERPSSPPWKTIGVAGFFVVCLIVVVTFWGDLFSAPISVSIVSATFISPSQSNAVLTASGYVVAQRKASVASKGTGRLVYLGVVEGDRVKEGQIIARLEDDDIRAQVAQAKATVRLNEAEKIDADRTLERTKSLFAKHLASQADLDAAVFRADRVKAAIDVASAALMTSEVALENTLIRAPFDGTVLTKNADVGEIVAPLAASASSRAAVVTIADMTSLEVEADVSESNIQRISSGQRAEISLDAYPGKRFQGAVTKIVPTADRAKATVLVKVGFSAYDESVLPEMSAKVLFLDQETPTAQGRQEPILALPRSAVVQRDGQSVVFRVVDGKARSMTIQTGQPLGQYVEILGGLTTGEKVVDNPGTTMKDGTSVSTR